MSDRMRTSPSAHFNAVASTSKATGPLVNVEDLFNYLYGYTPIRLVDPVHFQRERAKLAQLTDSEQNKDKLCKFDFKKLSENYTKIIIVGYVGYRIYIAVMWLGISSHSRILSLIFYLISFLI